MRTLRWLALSLALSVGIIGAGLWGALRWLESPAGCAWVSARVTRGLQDSAPGTEAVLEGVRFHRGTRAGIRVEVARAVWRKRAGGQELAELAPVEAWARLTGWPPRAVWEARGQVRRLDLSSELLQGLAAMMPAGSTRQALRKSFAGKALFHFNAGKIEVAAEPERYVLHLLVDGDHLLDITIRAPKESVEFLIKGGQ